MSESGRKWKAYRLLQESYVLRDLIQFYILSVMSCYSHTIDFMFISSTLIVEARMILTSLVVASGLGKKKWNLCVVEGTV